SSRAAVKLLHPDLARHDEVRSRFLREAYIANTVGHDGVVTVIDDDTDESGCPYLVMELLTGASLAAMAERAGGRMPVASVLSITDQALAILEVAHAKGVVHRDLKPDNLFMTDKGVVKMLDFGIARLRDGKTNRTKTGLLMGTPSFMAPEQALGRTSEIDGGTDQWAIGATMFNLLSGQYVHEADTDNELIIYAATRAARSLGSVLPDLPAPLIALVDRSLEYDRVKRFPDVGAMRAALAPLLREAGTAKHAIVPERAAADPARVRGALLPTEAPTSPGRAGLSVAPRITVAPSATSTRSTHGPPGASAPPGPSGSTSIAPRRPPSAVPAGALLDLEEAVGENLTGAKELFQRFEKALTTKHQYGPTHPEAARRYDLLFQKATEELARNEGGLAVNVTPYSFSAASETLWEPKAPLDQIPYRLFADGVRLVGFLPGLTDPELARFIKIITSDPVKEIPPGENLLTMIWDAAFEHIAVQEVDSFTEGDQAARQRFETDRNKIIAVARFDTRASLLDAWKGRARTGVGTPSGKADPKLSQVIQRVRARSGASAVDAARLATL
ncbi:serine/threonine protein kinase, partial [bacterium]